MDEEELTPQPKIKKKYCPDPFNNRCHEELEVLLFMGIKPDGYVCPRCRIYFSEDFRPLAYVV
jgi:hypothetical protein